MSCLCGHVHWCSGTTGGEGQEGGQVAVQGQEHKAMAGAL